MSLKFTTGVYFSERTKASSIFNLQFEIFIMFILYEKNIFKSCKRFFRFHLKKT